MKLTAEQRKVRSERFIKLNKSRIGTKKVRNINRTCSVCNKEYKAADKRSQFCSEKCAGKHAYHNGKKGITQRNKLKINRYKQSAIAFWSEIDKIHNGR